MNQDDNQFNPQFKKSCVEGLWYDAGDYSVELQGMSESQQKRDLKLIKDNSLAWLFIHQGLCYSLVIPRNLVKFKEILPSGLEDVMFIGTCITGLFRCRENYPEALKEIRPFEDVIRPNKIYNSLTKLNFSFEILPKKTKKFLSEKYNNLTFVKNKKNKEEIHREALLISFEGEDTDKSDKKRVFEYVGRNAEGKLVKDYFEAYSKVEVHSYLLSEGYEIYSIKTSKMIQFLHGTSGRKNVNFKKKDLIFFLTQLSTYIKSGITLVESLRILSHQYKKKRYQK